MEALQQEAGLEATENVYLAPWYGEEKRSWWIGPGRSGKFLHVFRVLPNISRNAPVPVRRNCTMGSKTEARRRDRDSMSTFYTYPEPIPTWTFQQNPSTNILNDVFMVDAQVGTTVGVGGIILHTSNGGATWTAQASGGIQTLFDVCFLDANTGIIAGASGTILRTTDGGATWTPQTTGTRFNLNGVAFLDADTGWAVGENGTILHTTNGGTTWTTQAGGTTSSLRAVAFADALNGTVIGELGTILRTTDGGATWTRQIGRTSNKLLGIYLSDANTGTIVGEFGAILHTTVGGEAEVGVAVEPLPAELPRLVSLDQNYPNPFNPTTTIGFTLSAPVYTSLVIYDLLGRTTATLVNASLPAGRHEVAWNAQSQPAGVYFYRLYAGREAVTRQLILLK